MKLLVYISFILSLIGCSNITFDGLQYDRFVTLVEDASTMKKLCGDQTFTKYLSVLKSRADHMKLYASMRSNSPEVLSSTTHLSSMVDELYNRYQGTEPSKAYCTEKLDMISAGAKTVAMTLGAQ